MKYKMVPLILVACMLSGQAMAQASAINLDPARARQWLEEYVRIWSSGRAVTLASVEKYYAPMVIYYGKPMTRAQVLRDKLRYIRQYPKRSYEIADGSVSITCDIARTLCRTSGVMTLRLEDRQGRASTRNSRLRLIISADAGGQIIRESADTLAR